MKVNNLLPISLASNFNAKSNELLPYNLNQLCILLKRKKNAIFLFKKFSNLEYLKF